MQIALSQGLFAEVDAEDFERLNVHVWSALKTKQGDYYAVRNSKGAKTRRLIFMHREILGITNSKIWSDHKDRDKLNNRRLNLRKATPRQNNQNKAMLSSNTSGYKGVTWEKPRQKWVAQIRYNDTHVVIGRFDDKIAAAKAYNTQAKAIFGEFALLNEIEED